MFTPADMEKMPIELEKLYAELEQRIMSDIVERMRKNKNRITSATDWQLYRLTELGQSSEEIKKLLGKALKKSEKEIDAVFDDALKNGYERAKDLYTAVGQTWIPFAENAALQQVIKAVKTQTLDEFKSITGSLGFVDKVNGRLVYTDLTRFYQEVLDNAVTDMTSGAFDYNTVLNRTVNTLTNSGLRTVDYASGRSVRIDTAVRNAVMTGVTQVTGKINEQNAATLNTEYYEVSWHGTARPEHQVWQGKVYSKEELVTVCGLGTVTGLTGANCRHTYYPFVPGVSERIYTDAQLEEMNARENAPREFMGKEYTAYEASQKQRKLELLMRTQREKIKLLEEGGASGDDIIAAKCRWRGTMDEYVRFSKAMGLPEQKARVYDTTMAHISAGKVKTVAKSSESGKIKSTIVKDAIKSGSVSKTININKQNRHIAGSSGYIAGRSYIKGNIEDAQRLIDKLAGTGEPIIDSAGKWLNKERVEALDVLGVHINPDDNKETETKKAIIVYSKTGSHIIPRKGE